MVWRAVADRGWNNHGVSLGWPESLRQNKGGLCCLYIPAQGLMRPLLAEVRLSGASPRRDTSPGKGWMRERNKDEKVRVGQLHCVETPITSIALRTEPLFAEFTIFYNLDNRPSTKPAPLWLGLVGERDWLFSSRKLCA